jgi:MoxR-like ATPase
MHNRCLQTPTRARAGKRELPAALRNRFTELYLPEPSAREDLRALVASYLGGTVPHPPVDAVVDFYLAARAEAVRVQRCCLIWLRLSAESAHS